MIADYSQLPINRQENYEVLLRLREAEPVPKTVSSLHTEIIFIQQWK
jgi:hypothetical protein